MVMRRFCLLLWITVGCAIGGAQPTAWGNTGTAVKISGRISKISLDGEGRMPALEVKCPSGQVWKVWLGSLRYLLEQDFNPKAGQLVFIAGYGRPGCPECSELLAASITLTDSRRTLRLRDDTGRPVWRCARYGRHK